jgi:hypothetical protein
MKHNNQFTYPGLNYVNYRFQFVTETTTCGLLNVLQKMFSHESSFVSIKG